MANTKRSKNVQAVAEDNVLPAPQKKGQVKATKKKACECRVVSTEGHQPKIWMTAYHF